MTKINNNAQESAKIETEAEFTAIIEAATNEDYEKCAGSALEFIEAFNKNHFTDKDLAGLCLPYVYYFKLFSEAYRTWQISYEYTPIRNRFSLAYQALHRKLKETCGLKIPADDLTLLKGFELLSKMLCAYTKCENSFINNDPFALKIHALEARQFELEALGNLKVLEGKFYHSLISEWLIEYFKKNYLLHDGLKDCAECYIDMLENQRPMTEKYVEKLENVEKNNLEPLREESAELSSELNAHVRIIRQHNERLLNAGADDTFLRINKGSLVLLMSAAFDPDSARQIFDVQKDFEENVENGFSNLGIEVSGCQIKQLHDVFQTSFGENYLKVLSFDLHKRNNSEDRKEVGIKILNNWYDFDVRFSLSALGVCTINFILDIDKLRKNAETENSNDNNSLRYKNGSQVEGMRVEEARVLQSLLCPHTGQVEIKDALSSKSKDNNFHFIKRLEFPALIEDFDFFKDLENLNQWVKDNHESAGGTEFYESLVKKLNSLNKAFEEIEKDWISEAKSKETNIESNNVKAFKYALDELTDINFQDDKFTECKCIINNIEIRLDTYHYLADLSEQFLEIIEDALTKTLNTESVNFNLARDTGWFTYLYCRSIDKVGKDDRETSISHSVGFDNIAKHPDMVGFLVEQREARASFDDWRFIKPLELENLAHIRSHLSDGFFCSEYQAFLYFPDDPMFLTDQYEQTVKLMVRLATVLRYISGNARDLAEKIHKRLHDHGKSIKLEELEYDLDNIRALRLHAKELQTLVKRAAISRYKDHGELMKQAMSAMKLDQMADLIEQQLQHLSELYADVLREIEGKRESKINRAIGFLTAVVGFSAIKDLSEAFADSFPTVGMNKNYLTLGLFLLAVSILIYFTYKWWKKQD